MRIPEKYQKYRYAVIWDLGFIAGRCNFQNKCIGEITSIPLFHEMPEIAWAKAILI
jgi:hypothetical protein